MPALLIDGNPERSRMARDSLRSAPDIAITVPAGLSLLSINSYQAVIARMPLADWTAEELLVEIQRLRRSVPVLIEQPEMGVQQAVRLVKLGAYHVFDEAVAPSVLDEVVEAAVEYRRSREIAAFGDAIRDEHWRTELIGSSPAMDQVMRLIRLAGPRKSTVLITGETGTGKELAARALHLASPRAHLPMVSVNCGALPEYLLEAELFGHVKGAFTGAVNHRIGRFEQAHRSTIFLDEIGEMPLELQSKLLRVLQSREFQRLGSSDTVHVDVRVIAATNVHLAEQVRAGKFREDLYYRLNVVPLTMPPLRERRGDIPSLVYHLAAKVYRQEDLPPRNIGAETLRRLCDYDWPGNVRELENAVEVAIILSSDRETLLAGDFPLPSVLPKKAALSSVPPLLSVPDTGMDFERTIGSIERTLLEDALRKSHGNKKRAAEMLRLKRTTLAAKLKSLAVVA